MAILILLNNFLHDFSAAGWLFSTVLLWSILRKRNPADNPPTTVVDLLGIIRLLMTLSLAGIVIFGTVRAFGYRTYEWNAAAGQGQVTLLIVKHVVFTIIFLPGLFLYMKAGRLLRKAGDDQAK